jgi:hypothetical protein
MGQPAVHFEIIGRDADRLRRFCAELFGWEFEVGDTVSSAVSAPGNHGFIDARLLAGAAAVNGGVGGGQGYEPRVLFTSGSATSRPPSPCRMSSPRRCSCYGTLVSSWSGASRSTRTTRTASG